MVKINKSLAAVAVSALMLSALTVNAQPMYMDFAAALTQAPGNGGTGADGDTYTGVFNQFQLFANTTTVQYDTTGDGFINIGDRFIDHGNAAITALLPPLADREGLNIINEITVSWSGLTGSVTSDLSLVGTELVQNIGYDTNNAIFSFYFHGDATAPNGNFGGTVGADDDTGFTDGELILQLQVMGGSGTNTFDLLGNFVSGSSFLQTKVVFALDNFFFFDGGDGIPGTADDTDFNTLLGMMIPIAINGNIDQNTDNAVTDFSNFGNPGPEGFGNELFRVHSDHDGSLEFAQVPIPSTTYLFLFAGVLLSVFAYKRKALVK